MIVWTVFLVLSLHQVPSVGQFLRLMTDQIPVPKRPVQCYISSWMGVEPDKNLVVKNVDTNDTVGNKQYIGDDNQLTMPDAPPDAKKEVKERFEERKKFFGLYLRECDIDVHHCVAVAVNINVNNKQVTLRQLGCELSKRDKAEGITVDRNICDTVKKVATSNTKVKCEPKIVKKCDARDKLEDLNNEEGPMYGKHYGCNKPDKHIAGWPDLFQKLADKDKEDAEKPSRRSRHRHKHHRHHHHNQRQQQQQRGDEENLFASLMDFSSTQRRQRRSSSADGSVGSRFADDDSDFGSSEGRVHRSIGYSTEEIHRQLSRVLRSAGAVEDDSVDGKHDASGKHDAGGEKDADGKNDANRKEKEESTSVSATDFLFPCAISLFIFLLVLILVVTIVLFVRRPAALGGARGGEGKRGVRRRKKGGKKSGDEGRNDEEEGDGEEGDDEDEEMVGGRGKGGGGEMEEDDPDCWRRLMFWR